MIAINPPSGVIWFGSSFDPDTFELRNRTTSFAAGEPFSAVASLARTMDGTDLSMRIYADGELWTSAALSWTGNGDLWGFSPGPAYSAGTWRYELVDVGGNVLATGTVFAT